MVKPTQPRKTVSTKLTNEEYARVVAAAGSDRVSKWVRDVVLAALDGGARTTTAAEPTSAGAASQDVEALMAELLAMRSLMLRLLFKVANGQGLTEDEMREIIADVDAKKDKRAQDRLSR